MLNRLHSLFGEKLAKQAFDHIKRMTITYCLKQWKSLGLEVQLPPPPLVSILKKTLIDFLVSPELPDRKVVAIVLIRLFGCSINWPTYRSTHGTFGFEVFKRDGSSATWYDLLPQFSPGGL